MLRTEVQRLTVAKRQAEARADANQAIADAARAELANYMAAAAAAAGAGAGGGPGAGAAEQAGTADYEKFVLRQQLQVSGTRAYSPLHLILASQQAPLVRVWRLFQFDSRPGVPLPAGSFFEAMKTQAEAKIAYSGFCIWPHERYW